MFTAIESSSALNVIESFTAHIYKEGLWRRDDVIWPFEHTCSLMGDDLNAIWAINNIRKKP